MATVKDSIPHVVRTAEDPRQKGLHRTFLSRIELVNQNIRVLRLSLPDGPLRHLPGQYIDLQIPSIETIGGFTITSPPVAALAPLQIKTPTSNNKKSSAPNWDPLPFIELAIQRSPNNPPAAFLYQPPPEILDTLMHIRVGGSFTYPPYTLNQSEFSNITNIVFIAGGVGINPIMSMLSSMDVAGPSRLDGMKKRVRVLYGCKRTFTKDTEDGESVKEEEILFEERLRAIARRWEGDKNVDLKYTLFETGRGHRDTSEGKEREKTVEGNFSRIYGRMTHQDVFEAIGDDDLRERTLVYVCGHPKMTDEYVELLRGTRGLDEKRVLCEKWW